MNYKEQIEKIAFEMTSEFLSKEAAAPSRDDDLNTRAWRDEVKPELKRAIKSLPAALPGAAIIANGAMTGLTPRSMMKRKAIGRAVSGIGAVGMHSYLKHKDMNKLSEKYLGHKATKTDHVLTQGAPIGFGALHPYAGVAASLIATPEARIQQLRRREQKEKINQYLMQQAQQNK